jgi:hypothetical protein
VFGLDNVFVVGGHMYIVEQDAYSLCPLTGERSTHSYYPKYSEKDGVRTPVTFCPELFSVNTINTPNDSKVCQENYDN